MAYNEATTYIIALLSFLLIIVSSTSFYLYIKAKRYSTNSHSKEDIPSNKKVFPKNSIPIAIRDPLTIISGSAEKLKSEKIMTLSDLESVKAIDVNIKRIFSLINNSEDVNRIQNGDCKLDLRQKDIALLTKRILNQHKEHLGLNDAQIEVKGDDNPVVIQFDELKISKVLHSFFEYLLYNFTNKDTIKVEMYSGSKRNSESNTSENIYKAGTTLSEFFEINVERSNAQPLQEAFFKANELFASPKDDYGYSSYNFHLAFLIIREYILLHKGQFLFENINEHKIILNIRLPLKSVGSTQSVGETSGPAELTVDLSGLKAVKEHQESIQNDGHQNKETILVIDDDIEIRQYIRGMLNETYQILEASNGAEGYQTAIEFQPDLIISDIIMPMIDGIELCKKIKTNINTSHIPVILLTSRSAVEHRIQGFEVGADYYISKPFNTLELVLRVKNQLETLHNQRKHYVSNIFQTPKQIVSNSTDEKFLSDVIKYLDENIDDPDVDIAGLSDTFNMSNSNLYRKIKSITGMSPKDFVINHKMKYAAHLLLSNKHSVKAVAYMVGFTDSRYFSTRFKNFFKCTPTQYIESYTERFLQEDKEEEPYTT